jgi:hypothetical protein
MKRKVGSLKRLTRLRNPLANMTKRRTEKAQINKIRDDKGDINTNTNEIQRINAEYSENLHSSKLENLDEMDKFLDAYSQPKLN